MFWSLGVIVVRKIDFLSDYKSSSAIMLKSTLIMKKRIEVETICIN